MRLTWIDETTRPDHSYLVEADRCFHIREYFARQGYQGGETNQLIFNYKIRPSVVAAHPRRGFYKERAVAQFAADLRASVSRENAQRVTWVPIPPSKVRGHADYDDRLLRTLRLAFYDYDVDIRELLTQTESTESDHTRAARLEHHELRALLRFDHAAHQVQPVRERIVLLDDVLTTGKHYKCCEYVIREALPNGPDVVGIFIARSVRPNPLDEFENLDPDL